MYLSRLELHGFKSFATRTVVEFAPGITVVVGPNGCGKSNIVDAVRWVIGEQRARILRSSKMENVIFNGAAKRRPLGMAEVLLTIENTRGVLPTEYTEVTLGRRLYRSGESEYLLNGVPCRLRDITDLFMDTGMGAGAYSVIELKMIDDILSENAHDRRHLFEEAAGITKYKMRRAQTLRKLDGTQVDLTRLRDLVEELEKRVRSLKRQAAKAERYKEYETRLRGLELALAQVEYERLTAQAQALESERQGLGDRLQEHNARLAQAEADLEVLRTRHIEREQALAARQTALNEHLEAVRRLEADRRLEAQRLETLRRDLDRTRREQTEAAARREELTRLAGRLAEDLAAVAPALEAAEEALEAARAARDAADAVAGERRRSLEDARREERAAADARAEHLRRRDRLAGRRELLEQDLERAEAQAAALDADAEALAARLRAAAERRDAAAEAAATARHALDEAEALRDEHARALEAALEARRSAERRRDAVAAEVTLLESLLASYEDFGEPVQFLAAESGWTAAPLRTVADVLACDDADRRALDAALGDLAGCIVVETEAEAHRALARLREAGKGRATFLVMERLKPVAPAEAFPRPLVSVVRAAEPYARLVPALLRDVYLVDDLDEARALAARADVPARFFTRSGEWVDARGLLCGGSAQAAVSPVTDRLGRRERLEAAQETLARLDEELERSAGAVAAARRALDAVPFAARRATLAEAERALAGAETAHARAGAESDALERRRSDLEARRAALRSDLEAAAVELETLEAAVVVAGEALEAARRRRAAAEDAFREAEAASRAALDRYGEAHVAAVEVRNRHDNLRRDRDRTRATLAELEARSETRAAVLERLDDELRVAEARAAELDDELHAVRENRIGLEENAGAAKAALMETKAAISELEAHLRELRREREHDMREESRREIHLAEVRTRAEDLLAHIEEDFGRSLLDDPVEVPPDFEAATAQEEVKRLRDRIRGMGPVNALALEAYDEENTRLEFLSTQLKDLEDAEATLLDTIDEINTTASARFAETFEAIRENFRRLFAELFGEDASADVTLRDPGDLLESPIEIMAKPRGKRPSTLAQLSGGEKTLTAIALLFAIYLVKPSPFCILDEVDAPLDDTNIDRFMKLIRSFSETTQFILVTHNKRTMEAADRMYGITMQEHGVSQLVGVKFDEAVAMAEG
ncbi:chromosome segregation protein SMC [Rhodocaloribacter sp.]